MSKKLSYSITIALVLVSCFATYLVDELVHSYILDKTNSTIDIINANSNSSDINIESIQGYKYIKPIVAIETKNESIELISLKTQITN